MPSASVLLPPKDGEMPPYCIYFFFNLAKNRNNNFIWPYPNGSEKAVHAFMNTWMFKSDVLNVEKALKGASLKEVQNDNYLTIGYYIDQFLLFSFLWFFVFGLSQASVSLKKVTEVVVIYK